MRILRNYFYLLLLSFSVSNLSAAPDFLFNASPRPTYLAGVYDGFYPYADLLKEGDFGLGAADKNDGELLVLNGTAYRSRINGVTNKLKLDEKTPYATVVFFKPTETYSCENMTMEKFQNRFDLERSPKNRIYAIRITGSFIFVEAGASAGQTKPYRSFAKVFKEYVIQKKEPIDGDLVGFRCPSMLQGIDKVGFHFHFIDHNKSWGGHVFNFAIKQAKVSVQKLDGYSVVMPKSTDVLDLDLDAYR
jgi:acetolactate decarboxylase